ncbi:MAG: hypothetical protein BZ136_04975 [Methanosphaera sp. rholeuAM74]|nr:MAG: hypothetical protein BZ136_04975 [Methanosphaera sp. rholeuAM74]
MDEYEIKSYVMNLINTTPKFIESKLKYEYKYLKERNEYFELKEYIDNFLNEINQDKFLVLSGLRGVGKTTITYQLYNYLINEMKIPSKQILYLDLERLKDEIHLNILDYFDVFIKDINEEYQYTDEPLFIFVDESQYDTNWASHGKVVYDENINVFTLFTGSNALNLTSNADTSRRAIRKELYPLNFSEYLEIKYNANIPNDMENAIMDLLYGKNIDKISKIEQNLLIKISQNNKKSIRKCWEDFIQYGNLPFGLYKKHIDLLKETLEIKDKIIEQDMVMIKSFNSDTIHNAHVLVNIMAKMKPGQLSNNNLSSDLDITKDTISKILTVLEKTQLLFSVDRYGTTTKRENKIKKYYFLATQFKAAFFQIKGDISNDYRQYMGILLENLVASELFKLKSKMGDSIEIYYDSKGGGVDFIIKNLSNKPVPIEVGIGKKNKKQIKKAINKYNADYGIVISDKTDYIFKEDDVIFIPYTTFSLL